jgi:hypothetical protein
MPADSTGDRTALDRLAAKAAAVEKAERVACTVLAEGMRELAVQLPESSRLALDLASCARKLAHTGDPNFTSPGVYGASTMRVFVRDLYLAGMED